MPVADKNGTAMIMKSADRSQRKDRKKPRTGGAGLLGFHGGEPVTGGISPPGRQPSYATINEHEGWINSS